ncbi:MAG: RBBP9/YdeN family alpha/beta hydrolase [Candidatus Levyibacteriota bacterium]
MKKAVILQGWYQKPTSNWYNWLKEELEKQEYLVFLPDLSTMHTDLPDMQLQLKEIEKLATLDKDTIVIGHSIGCLLAMRLAEKHKLHNLYLIAGWDFNDLTEEHRLFWPNAINHSEIIKNTDKIYCITSNNDPYMTPFTVESMTKRLHGEFILIKNGGHFNDKFGIKEIPELLQYI